MNLASIRRRHKKTLRARSGVAVFAPEFASQADVLCHRWCELGARAGGRRFRCIWAVVFCGWRGLGGAGFWAVGRGIGEGPISSGGARREKCQKSRSDPKRAGFLLPHFLLLANNRKRRDHLVSLGIAHDYLELPGVGHDALPTLSGGAKQWEFYQDTLDATE